MYTGSLQQLQMIQQAELCQEDSEPTREVPQEAPPLSRPLILSMAQGWGRLWSDLAQRRDPSRTAPRHPRAV